MDLTDDMLVSMFRIHPSNVPITKIGRCLGLLQEEERAVLIRSLTARKPRNDTERRVLLHYALSEGIGGVLFADALGGFEGLRPC